jgi:beta-glucanase (GH16 family)
MSGVADRRSVRRRRWSGSIVALTVIASMAAVQAPSRAASDVAWRDDFTSFDTSTWQAVDGNCFTSGNASVANGMLRLRIATSKDPDCPTTGARVNTYGLRDWPPGTFSARIRFVTAPGSWQTFWLTGASGRTFPANGEVDIAEIIGRTPGNTHVALHSAFLSGGTRRCDQGAGPAATVDRTWHVYSVTTSATVATFRIDGRVVASFRPNGICSWPFGDRMRILFSSRGGGYGGTVDPSRYPVTYLVDWVSWTPP